MTYSSDTFSIGTLSRSKSSMMTFCIFANSSFSVIINKIFRDLDIPEKLKSGVVTPVLKPNKDERYPGNYRGITVANTLSTIVESILKERIEPKLLLIQSKLQRGFTNKSSSLNIACDTCFATVSRDRHRYHHGTIY
jgi:hypothetical protein